MKFAHMADSHLGYRQYGLIEREEDFYNVFDKCVDKIIEEKCDFVIHSGDLFEVAKPSPKALLRFQKAFLKLKEADIPVYAIAGNHDSVRRSGAIPPQILFKDLGLKLISPKNPMYVDKGVFICGLPFMPKSNKDFLLDKYKEFSKEADHHIFSILVSHQGIDKYLPFNYELEIGDLPDNFNYYAMGHVHKYINEAYGKGRLVYPGSSEIWKSDEYGDYSKKGKGFAIVEVSDSEPLVKRVTVDLPRKFIKEYIHYEDLDKKLALIKTAIKNLDNKPILEIIVENGDFKPNEVSEKITQELGEYALTIRPSFKPNKTIAEENLNLEENGLGARQLLIKNLNEKYNTKEINDFAIELLDSLSKDTADEAQLIADEFYKKHFESNEYSDLIFTPRKNFIAEDIDLDNDSVDEKDLTKDVNISENEDSEELAENSLDNYNNEEQDSDEENHDDINNDDEISNDEESPEEDSKPRILNRTPQSVREKLIRNDNIRFRGVDKNQTTLFDDGGSQR